MSFRKGKVYVALDDLSVVIARVVGVMTLKERFGYWREILIENPARVNYAVITDLSQWSGFISEEDIYTIVAWYAQFRQENDVPHGQPGRLAWVGRDGAGLNLLVDMVNKIRPNHAFHTATVQEAWKLVMPDVAMPSVAKKFFGRRLIF
jgi:hypothetical protein